MATTIDTTTTSTYAPDAFTQFLLDEELKRKEDEAKRKKEEELSAARMAADKKFADKLAAEAKAAAEQPTTTPTAPEPAAPAQTPATQNAVDTSTTRTNTWDQNAGLPAETIYENQQSAEQSIADKQTPTITQIIKQSAKEILAPVTVQDPNAPRSNPPQAAPVAPQQPATDPNQVNQVNPVQTTPTQTTPTPPPASTPAELAKTLLDDIIANPDKHPGWVTATDRDTGTITAQKDGNTLTRDPQSGNTGYVLTPNFFDKERQQDEQEKKKNDQQQEQERLAEQAHAAAGLPPAKEYFKAIKPPRLVEVPHWTTFKRNPTPQAKADHDAYIENAQIFSTQSREAAQLLYTQTEQYKQLWGERTEQGADIRHKGGKAADQLSEALRAAGHFGVFQIDEEIKPHIPGKPNAQERYAMRLQQQLLQQREQDWGKTQQIKEAARAYEDKSRAAYSASYNVIDADAYNQWQNYTAQATRVNDHNIARYHATVSNAKNAYARAETAYAKQTETQAQEKTKAESQAQEKQYNAAKDLNTTYNAAIKNSLDKEKQIQDNPDQHPNADAELTRLRSTRQKTENKRNKNLQAIEAFEESRLQNTPPQAATTPGQKPAGKPNEELVVPKPPVNKDGTPKTATQKPPTTQEIDTAAKAIVATYMDEFRKKENREPTNAEYDAIWNSAREAAKIKLAPNK